MQNKLILIIWKNIIIRKRHWFLTLLEIVIPSLLFMAIAYARSEVEGLSKQYIAEPTFHEISHVTHIYSHLPVGEIKLWYCPQNEFTEGIIKRVQEKFQITGDDVKEFSSKEDLLLNFGKNESQLIAAIIFNGNDARHFKYDLTIYDKHFMWQTDKLFVPAFSSEEMTGSNYMYRGYAALQVALDTSYMEFLNGSFSKRITFSVQQFPEPPHTDDSGLNQIMLNCLPLVTIFTFIFLCPAVLQRVGEEISSGTREYMKMVGLKSWLIWLGWFIHALSTNLISIVVIIIVMKVPLWGVPYPLIEYSNGAVLFTFLFLYCMAAVTFCFLIASILSTPSIATLVGVLAWILSYFIPKVFLSYHEYLKWKCKIPFAIFPNIALYYGYSSIAVYETREIGSQWYNIFTPASGDDNDITMGNVLMMLIFDTIFFMLLTIYIENVKPGEYGIARPYMFPIINIKNFVKKLLTRRVENSPENESLETDLESGKIPCIQICNLHKKFYNHMAVDDLNMDVYKNHITVLLGQNGAGKTTTMSILTGMISATSGYVKVNGKDIKKHTDDVRSLMGLCPQHNLLFPDLTVFEHLKFFAMLKGSSNPDADVTEMLKTLGLENKDNDLANVLSGGMKRKLCLGMALIGNSEILILDEPTSGMDPESRRRIWDLLLENRKSRTVLITTHFMEEADVLGEWIAIMAKGRLQCYGTPSQLKAKYNTGYHLSLLLRSKKNVQDVTALVRQHFTEAKLLRETEDSVVYLLPLVQNEKIKYKDLIVALEDKQCLWDIVAINMNETTLNDVFLKARDELDGVEHDYVDGVNSCDILNYKHVQGMKRSVNIVKALLKKRYYFLRKKYYLFVPTVVLSLSIFLLAIWLALSSTSHEDGGGPPLNLTLDIYGKTKVYYGGNNSANLLIAKARDFYSKAASVEGGMSTLSDNVSYGIIESGISNIAFYKRHIIVAAEFNGTTDTNDVVVNAMFSSEALHGIPISINLAMNAIVKLINESYSISISNTPLKPLYSESSPTELSYVDVTTLWLILFPISMFFFVSSFIIFPNSEVSTDFIQIQTIAGIKTYVYWLSNILFDVVFALLPLGIFFFFLWLIDMITCNSRSFDGAATTAMFTILMTYIFVTLPFAYLLSYRKTVTGGFTALIMLGIFTGIIPSVIVGAMEFSKQERYVNIGKGLKYTLMVTSPQFALSYICMKFTGKYVQNYNWRFMDPNKQRHLCVMDPNPCCSPETTSECSRYQNYFLNEDFGIQKDLLLTLSGFAFYFCLLLFLNTEAFKKLLHFIKYIPHSLISAYKNDPFKYQVTELVTTPDSNEESQALLVKNLTKTFGDKAIVKNLKFNLKKNKCFGLLGVNGAGKSTTFRMLTKYLFFDKGDIVLKSDTTPISIKTSEYCEKIGYCPQEDCLNYSLTGRELLETMAHVKGYTDADSIKITNSLLKYFGLEEYANKPCLEYSGGNKRKLSTCLAFLGSPKVILLDEPTSGVDPASRRNFWKILSSFKQADETSFLLCSHSMEECENLCDEIAIMKGGEIKDQGSLLALKSKYQKGFKVTIKLKNGTNNVSDIKEDIAELGADLLEEYGGSLTYQIQDSNKRLSELFSALEALKEKYKDGDMDVVEDYVINQISLEDVFLTVAENN